MAKRPSRAKPDVTGGADEKHLFGFIERKASWASLFALLISLCAGAYQLYWFLQGPEVELLVPQQVMFNQADKQRVRMIVPLTFKNESLPRYGEVIVGVTARLHARIGGFPVSVPFAWQNFVRSNPLADLKKDEKPLIYEGEVVPLMINGASAVSEDVEFLPSKPVCLAANCPDPQKPHIMHWTDLVAAARGSDRLQVEIIATGSTEGRYSPVICTIIVDAQFVPTLLGQLSGQDPDHPYHAPPCAEAAERLR